MLRSLVMVGFLGVAATGSAVAQNICPCVGGSATLLGQSAVNTALSGNTVCAVLGSERWQEWHNGASIFELGENFANPDLAGSWSTSSAGEVTYNYGSGGTYTYAMCQDGSDFHFCGAVFGGRNVLNATLRTGKASCTAPALAAQVKRVLPGPSTKRAR